MFCRCLPFLYVCFVLFFLFFFTRNLCSTPYNNIWGMVKKQNEIEAGLTKVELLFYPLEYLNYCLHFHCYTDNVLTFCSCFRSPHRISNQILCLIQCYNSVNHSQVQVLSYSKYSLLSTCSWDWTCNLQMILFRSTF